MNEARIRLAEAIGGPIWEAYINPGKHPECVDLPDPFTDANDCDALKKYMQSQGWHIEIGWQHLNENAHSDSYLPAPAIYVEIWHCGTEQHERYDTDRGEPYTVAACACLALGIPLHVEDKRIGTGLCPYCDHRIANIELKRESDGELHCNHCRGKRQTVEDTK